VPTFPIVMADNHQGSFLIRRFEPADRPVLEAMYEDFSPKRAAQGLPPEGAEPLRRWLDRILAAGQHLLVEVEGRVVGHVMLIPMEGGSVELANFLHQSIRNRGIGTSLNRLLLQVARDDGFRRVWLSVEPSNRAAVRSYEKAGFRKLPGSLWSPEIEMAVELQPAAP
jgi:RimJ/RimL family protein N-acetyltransferase